VADRSGAAFNLGACARQIEVVRQLRREVPGLPLVGSAYTYLQEYLPHVAQAVVREGWVDFVGIGRMVLCYQPVEKGDWLRTDR
jgi:2,4-dienoyl-CoA reductase-like NADH-dependent reductase (Old Yellow Enzyme family)